MIWRRLDIDFPVSQRCFRVSTGPFSQVRINSRMIDTSLSYYHTANGLCASFIPLNCPDFEIMGQLCILNCVKELNRADWLG
jgi:hypothetical protein